MNSKAALALALAAATLATRAPAAEAPAAAALETVTVTARLRSEDAQQVPMALSVVDSALLDATATYNVSQLTQLVPSVNYSSPNPRNTALTIRGLGSSVVAIAQANDGLEPGVGFYVDQVYHARPATAAFDLLDLEHVEVLRGPQGVVEHVFTSEAAADNRDSLWLALGETLPITLLGMFAGLAVALAFAVATTVWRSLGRTLLPLALVSQSMPLVALTPLVVLVFGRGSLSILVVTVSVTFFPAFVTIAQGLALVPASATDLVRVYGARRWRQLQLVALPWSLPYLCAAARLAAPRAFLGVMIAEWLATGTGIGNLLNVSRGVLDFGMIWTVAVVAIAIAVLLNGVVVALERYVLHRYALAGV